MKDPQTEIPGTDVDPRAARRARALIDLLHDALERRFGSLERAAEALDGVFGPEGRGVAGSTLRAACRQAERNYFRLEWIVVVMDDPEVIAFFAAQRRTPAEQLAALREHMAKNARGELDRFDRTEARRG